jgi:hypothetical protein
VLRNRPSRPACTGWDAASTAILTETQRYDTEIVERYFATHRGARGIRAARSQYDVWLAIEQRAQWRNPEDVKSSHLRVRIL